MSLTVAIVGRTNVGKSTLFNRLVGRRLALVDDRPGVTRDLREGEARIGDLRFTVLDTAGLETATDESLEGRMRRLTERAVRMADLCLFLVDARAGILAGDRELADMLRRHSATVVLAANKAESPAADAGVFEAYGLGFGDPVRISAEHGIGLDSLHFRLTPLSEGDAGGMAARGSRVGAGPEPGSKDRSLRIAVVGRPNAGKSTLINRIIGDERLLTGPEAGITRDAIGLEMVWCGARTKIFDTAGMRRKAKVSDRVEKLSVSDGLRAVRFAEVVILLLDAAIPFEQQDLRIADLAEREGRAIVVALNKWDLQDLRKAGLPDLRKRFERLLPQLRGAPLVPVSAMTGQGLAELHSAVLRAHDIWNRRVPTAKLNQWLAQMVVAHPPPAPGGRRVRLRYITQAGSRPPGFVVMCSHPERIPASYIRYLVNGLREDFDMPGTPIRFHLRSQADRNPYREKRKPAPSRLRKHLERKVRSG